MRNGRRGRSVSTEPGAQRVAAIHSFHNTAIDQNTMPLPTLQTSSRGPQNLLTPTPVYSIRQRKEKIIKQVKKKKEKKSTQNSFLSMHCQGLHIDSGNETLLQFASNFIQSVWFPPLNSRYNNCQFLKTGFHNGACCDKDGETLVLL